MKKIILAILVTACSISQINAQFKFGLKAGANFNNVKVKEAPATLKVDNLTGWQAGALLQIKIPAVGIAVQPELLYTARKFKIDEEKSGINYFEVPINLQLGLNLVLLRPYLQAGPYFGYVLNADGENFKDKIDKFDWGIGLGGGLEIWKLQLDARYSWGLQNVSAKDFQIKNNRFTLSLAYLF